MFLEGYLESKADEKGPLQSRVQMIGYEYGMDIKMHFWGRNGRECDTQSVGHCGGAQVCIFF